MCAGVTVAVGKLVSAGVTSLSYVFFLSLMSVFISVIWIKFKKYPIEFLSKDKLLVFYGHIACSFLAIWTFWEGTRLMNAGVASFSVRIELIFVLIISWIVFRERMTKFDLIGACLIFLGASLMGAKVTSFNEGGLSNSFFSSKGGLLMLASGASFAGAEAFANRLAGSIHSSSLVLWRSLALSGLYAIAMGFSQDVSVPTLVDGLVIALAAFLGPFLARIFFMEALPEIGLAKASLLSQLEPVVTTIVAWGILGELISPLDSVGGGLVLAGCLALNLNLSLKQES